MELRCIHTADVHIGLEFNNASFGSEYGKKRRKEIFNTFIRIIERTKEINAHFLFISGDLYEDEYCSIGDIKTISDKLSELNETKVIIISGNHDYLHNKSLYDLVYWPPNVYIIDSSTVTNTIGVNPKFEPGISYCLKTILKWGIVLLGVKLNFEALLDLGPYIVFIIVFLITFALILSNLFGKVFKINSKLSTLLGVGSSICGASAVVAMGPVINANEEDTAISVAVISLLGALGVIIYTSLSYLLPLSDLQYGIWSGSSLQGVAHALAAAGARGADGISMEIGTVVKMGRVALLAPVALILSLIFNKDNKSNKKVKFPMYVLYFIIVGIIFNINSIYNIFPEKFSIMNLNIDLVNIIKKASNFFILMAMVSMGLTVNFKSFKSKGLKALYSCSILFIIISLTSLILIMFI